jgi:hypothetical protein
MATPEQEAQQRASLSAVLEKLNQIRPETLVRREVLGQALSFEAGLPIFERTLGLFRDLSICALDNAPFEVLQQLTNVSEQAFRQFQQIQSFSLEQNPSNPAAQRDSLIDQLRNQWNSYYTTITPHISYSIRKGTDFDSLEREARGSLSLTKQIVTDLRTEKDKILADMQGALEKVRQAAAEAGVAQHAIHFREEAVEHLKQSRVWLAATVLSGFATIAVAIYTLGIQLHDIAKDPQTKTGELVQLAIARIVVVSVMSIAVAWCGRNYSASRHNFVINRHRQNALSTFETFVKAAGDQQTKDAVLVQATQSIFSPQASGYLKNESDGPQSTQIIELVRGLAGSKG